MRIAIVGLYDSGSTCLAGVLHHLGVDLGAPFYLNNASNFYEPYDLSCLLRYFWAEPKGKERTPAETRIKIFRNWIFMRESLSGLMCGAKHPLLSLSISDLRTAWGPDTLFLWAYRPLEESILKLKKRKWFGEHAEPLQRKLWSNLNQSSDQNVLDFERIPYQEMQLDRQGTVDRLIKRLSLSPTNIQIQNAVNWIRPLT